MPVYKLEAFPQHVRLRNGAAVELKPMVAADRERVLEFFLRVPEEDRYFLKDDVTSPRVIEGWASNLDYDRALPLLAWIDGLVVGDAVLVRSRTGARSHIGELRIVVDPEYRNLGLGSILGRQLCEIAADAELEKVIIELVADRDQEAIAAMEPPGLPAERALA